ncbi:MAG: response regulator transcription factor [Lachnospiraceae bacterium]|nr:response regulator transcription factor [Lachnospiraceae bacterium]
MSYKILIADDEPEIRDLLRLYLENEKYEVVEAANGVEALRLIDVEKPDLIMLDIMMPQMDGYQVLKHIREDNNVPVIIISAKDEDSEKILGLNLGADDYIAKPFNPLEVIARVNSGLRRFYSLGATTESETGSLIQVRDLELDPESFTLTKAGEVIELTSVEYKIMELLMTHPGKVFTKQQIYEYAWGDEYFVADNNIMVCISKLRSKLSDENSEYIKTLRGLGYRLEK